MNHTSQLLKHFLIKKSANQLTLVTLVFSFDIFLCIEISVSFTVVSKTQNRLNCVSGLLICWTEVKMSHLCSGGVFPVQNNMPTINQWKMVFLWDSAGFVSPLPLHKLNPFHRKCNYSSRWKRRCHYSHEWFVVFPPEHFLKWLRKWAVNE